MIYLASNSAARKKLLKNFGIKFRVIPSRVSEKKTLGAGAGSAAELVKHNALLKAKAVAAGIKQGIIIGADTIAVQNGRVCAKPKDTQDARLMLKRLSRQPHWVYSAVAVIDKDTGRVMVDYEKTKVFMDKLTDKEISRYFSRASPLDKAGSFDIQGRGAFFIRRIEGCFYNVVGLPMRKLYLMLKSIDVRVFSVLCTLFSVLFLTSGCSTEYNVVTGKEETYYYNYDTDHEVQMGYNISKEVDKEMKAVEDPLIQKRVEDIGKKIAAVCDRKEITYHFKAVEDEEINAFSLPGGYIYVNKGLVDKVASDDELAGVLAHEIGHVVARHSIKKMQALNGYSFLRLLVAVAPQGGSIGSAADLAFTEILLGYGREDELLADQLGARYLKLVGYNPRGMITFLERLQEIERRKPERPKNYFKTHPYVPDRIRIVKQELGENIKFSDYINIEQQPAR